MVVISDLHLGSPYCRYEAIAAFLHSRCNRTTIVLNGDTIDRPGTPLPAEANAILTQFSLCTAAV